LDNASPLRYNGTNSRRKEKSVVSEILETLMVVSFGVSWPLSIIKSWRSRTTRGKSLPFLLFILFGYGCGIASKLVGGAITYVFYFYALNFIMVSADVLLYARNSRIQRTARESDRSTA
jgi:hypothetical protein